MEKTIFDTIVIRDCHVDSAKGERIPAFSWNMENGTWLVTGESGGGKEDFLSALSLRANFVPEKDGAYFKNDFSDSTTVVSLEEAARVIEEERLLDETDHMDRIDEGRTVRRFLSEVLGGPDARHRATPLPDIASKLESFPEVKLCAIQKILDRGLKFLSTGEIRRTLLCRALLSKSRLLILSDPFSGLDLESRTILFDFFSSISSSKRSGFPKIMIFMERYKEIPHSVTHVLAFSKKQVCFCGSRSEFEKIVLEREENQKRAREKEKKAFLEKLGEIWRETAFSLKTEESRKTKTPLVEMKNVNVGWNEKLVLRDFSWTVFPGEHWLIQGPNGSGKTTLLELITGDNHQVFSNDVWLFGARRGSGESIWDIKKRLGIVSYRLHVEYRMVGSASLCDVIASGFRDSIGLYSPVSDVEKRAARLWLSLGGFSLRENEPFSSLSYGEQRAVLILRAAVKNPEILILDEPCHALDDAQRTLVLDLLERIAETGTTTILHVTHDISEALECEKNVLELLPQSEPMYRVRTR
mgnify:CR=1 FL=1